MEDLILFFSLTLAVTWSAWAAAILVAREGVPFQLLLYLGIFTPALVALGLTARSEGRQGVEALLRRLVQWQVATRWYLFAIFYLVAVKLAAAVVYRIVGGVWPAFNFETLPLMLAATALSTVVMGQAGEELGWRGYALPRLERHLGLGMASILIGMFWASWHLPLFYLPASETSGQSFPLYLVQVTGLSVAIGCLYGHTNRSLLLVMLMHAAINNTKDIVPALARSPTNPFSPGAPLLGWIGAAIIWTAAVPLLITMPKRPPIESR